MSATVEIEDALAALLHQTNQPLDEAAREMIVLEVYRRGSRSRTRKEVLARAHPRAKRAR